MIGSSQTMYAPPRGQISTAQPRSVSGKHNLLTPTTNSPTHVPVPHSPDDRLPGTSASTSVSLTRSDPSSEPKYPPPPPRGEFSFSDDSFVPLVEDQNLDDLWDTLRQKKEARMSKEKSKVRSLEQPSVPPSVEYESPDPPPPPPPEAPPSARTVTPQQQPKSIKRVKSLCAPLSSPFTRTPSLNHFQHEPTRI